jgi:TPR repeat protein
MRGPMSTARPGLVRLPPLLAVVMFAALLLERVQAERHLFWTFVLVPTGLLLWFGWLRRRAARRGAVLAVEPAPPVRQHYVQACVQCCLYAYWGYHWQQDGGRPMYAQLPLILSQFAFLYSFDGLLAWSLGRAWRLASGPVPIVLSTNLFIWFRDEWFVLQFAMVAAGLLGKEFLKWQKDGRRTHVFNPSGFGLACAATLLIVFGATDLTWAKSLATTIEVPGIFVFLFLLGMVVQHFFQVTLMTFAAALVMIGCNLLYTQVTGVWLFASSNLPAAAFLGLHLLMTDPSTSPRSNVGRALFGAGYGLGYVIAFEVLGALGAPELYAKLYPVPILNCCVQWLDRLARGRWFGRIEQRWQNVLPARATNAIHMAAWAAVFAVMLGTGYVQSRHPGDSIAFWKQAVVDGKPDAQRKLVMVAGSQAVAGQSGDAYNELGVLSLTGSVDPASAEVRHKSAANWFWLAAQRGCDPAHENVVAHFLYDGARRSDQDLARSLARLEQLAAMPGHRRAAQLLGLVHETGGGVRIDIQKALQCYRSAGADRWAAAGIARIGLVPGALVELAAVAPVVAAAAADGDGECCFLLAWMHATGRGVAVDADAAARWLARACELGFAPACELRDRLAGRSGWPPFQAPRRKQLSRPPWSTAFPVGS